VIGEPSLENSEGQLRMSIPSDLHVSELHYRLVDSPNTSYNAPAPIEFETDEAKFRLADGELRVDMKVHTCRQDEARDLVDPILKAWETVADLDDKLGEVRFKFVKPVIIDRSPVEPGSARVHLVGVECRVEAGAIVATQLIKGNYPSPPASFRLTPDAESLWIRFRGYLEGREPLLSMAYFCLTVLSSAKGGIDNVAGAYKVDKAVLKKIGELSSTRGDGHTARKFERGKSPQPLTGVEKAWLEAAIKALIKRVGDISAGTLECITMSDLPAL
jgi:hypothetical protein